MPSARQPRTRLGWELRRRRGKRTQRDVALEVGISVASISRLEAGIREPSLSTAIAVARWLGWTVEELAVALTKPPPE